MGKRQIGELQPSELVITILISELGSMPIQDTNLPILAGIIPIFTLAAIEIAVSVITLSSVKARNLIYGKPIVLVYKGKIYQKEMTKARVSIDDLIEAMRGSGITKVQDIDFAILETNGNMSIIPKTDNQEIPDILVTDGKIMSENIKKSGLTKEYVDRTVKANGFESTKEVFLFAREKSGKTYFIKKEKKR